MPVSPTVTTRTASIPSLANSASIWRREWDSNPRYGFPYTRFPSVRLQPLGHPSGAGRWVQYSDEGSPDNQCASLGGFRRRQPAPVLLPPPADPAMEPFGCLLVITADPECGDRRHHGPRLLQWRPGIVPPVIIRDQAARQLARTEISRRRVATVQRPGKTGSLACPLPPKRPFPYIVAWPRPPTSI
jgi:hypothetical protein